jgi:LacI family transcriptional regulator
MAVTLRDIARKLNLSHATVSFVLNDRRDVSIPETTRKRVMEAAQELGYRPNRAARALVSGRSQTLAIWAPTLDNMLYVAMFNALQRACHRRRHATYFFDGDLASSAGTPFEWPVDGVLTIDAAGEWSDAASSSGLATVNVGVYGDDRSDWVELDLRPGTMAVARALVEAGCKKLAFLSDHLRLDEPSGRYAAFRGVVESAGLKAEGIKVSGPSREEIANALRKSAAKGGMPEGICCTSDTLALAAHSALCDMGLRVPVDVRLAGCDGSCTKDCLPASIMTVRQPIDEACNEAVQVLFERMNSPRMSVRRIRMETSFNGSFPYVS